MPQGNESSLHREFKEKWIVEGGLFTENPARLCLHTLGLFFRRYIKNAMYVAKLTTTLPEVAGRIKALVVTDALDLINNLWTEAE